MWALITEHTQRGPFPSTQPGSPAPAASPGSPKAHSCLHVPPQPSIHIAHTHTHHRRLEARLSPAGVPVTCLLPKALPSALLDPRAACRKNLPEAPLSLALGTPSQRAMAKETRLLSSVCMIQVYKADTRWTWARASVEREDVVISGGGGGGAGGFEVVSSPFFA